MSLLRGLLRTHTRCRTQVPKAVFLLSSDYTLWTPLASPYRVLPKSLLSPSINSPDLKHPKDVSLLPALNSLEPNANPKSSFHGRYMVLGWSFNLRSRS